MRFDESTVRDLQQSAIDAFPHTTRRQHATATIAIEAVNYLPFFGVRTLLVRARADNTSDGGGVYRPLMLFRNVSYHEGVVPGARTLREQTGQPFILTPVSESGNDVLVRCQCEDFQWRFNYPDYLDSSLYGVKR